MADIRKFVAPEIIFGSTALGHVGRYARNFGAEKPFIVTDPGVMQAGWAQEVMDQLEDQGLAYVLFSGVSPNPRDFEVMEGAEMYLQNQCDLIIAVGGGSVMDCAKGIGIVSTNGLHISVFEGIDNVDTPGPPLICIPTTSGSSADVSQFAIINDTGRRMKFAIISNSMVPDLTLIDPRVCMTMSPYLTACTAMDALVHAIEAFVSTAHSSMTDLHALEAIRLLRTHLPLAVNQPDDLSARTQLMLGSMQAGLAFSNASLGAVHSLAHSLGGYLDLPHGECNAILLDHVIMFNYKHAPERYDRVARELGIDIQGRTSSEKARLLLQDLTQLKKELGIAYGLADKGLKVSDVKILAQHAVKDPCLITNPRKAKQRDLEVLYEEAL